MNAKDDKRNASFDQRLHALLDGREHLHPAEVFRDVDDDFWLWINTEGRERSDVLRDMLPGLPDPEVQRRWTGKTGLATMTEGFAIYRTMRDMHARKFGELRDHGPILDFGCGFGRVIRYFVKDVAPGQLMGTDYNDSLIDYCVTTNPWCSFTHNEANPPLAVGDNDVGYIYAYSVFSHFSEPMHRRWLEEFKRVLRPGGVVAVTVRPRGFIEHCRRLRTGEATGVSPINRQMFLDADAALARYDSGEFAFSPYDPDDPDAWWGEACISREYVEQHWTDLFDVVDFVSASELMQHVVLLRA